MASTTLSTKGQVVIPREVRQRLGWLPGTTFEIEIESPDLLTYPHVT